MGRDLRGSLDSVCRTNVSNSCPREVCGGSSSLTVVLWAWIPNWLDLMGVHWRRLSIPVEMQAKAQQVGPWGQHISSRKPRLDSEG